MPDRFLYKRRNKISKKLWYYIAIITITASSYILQESSVLTIRRIAAFEISKIGTFSNFTVLFFFKKLLYTLDVKFSKFE